MIGTTIAHYRIGAKLGEGGMGEVWRATDTRLKREVAIKVLPPGLAGDPERLARFEREAQALAQLQHPNIASIYGLVEEGPAAEAGGVRAIVLELVEGETLAERLERGPLPQREALEVARQIALGLEAAHEKSIVHRDLKPQNVKAPADGVVKILDFGLAKALEPIAAASAGELAKSPTLTLGATVQGVLLGTAAYMAPEQAKGTAVDKRADVWAFGVVVWEMLSGRRLFAGDSVPETLAEVLKSEVDLDALPPGTPPAVRRLLRRCLERSPRNRLHDIADARLVLEDVLAGRADETAASGPAPGASAHVARRARRTGLLLGGALGAAAAVAALVASGLAGGRGPATAAGDAGRPAAIRTLVAGSEAGFPALSPDGGTLAYVAARDAGGAAPRIWIKDLASGSESPLGPPESGFATFSPDGTSLLFTVAREGPDELHRIALATRETRRLAGEILDPGGPGWSPDGRSVVFGRLQEQGGQVSVEEIVATDLGAGTERVLDRRPPDLTVGFLVGPRWSPDGRRIARVRVGAQAGIGDRIAILDVSTGEQIETPIALTGLDGVKVLGLDWISSERLALLLADGWIRITSAGRIAVFDVATRTTRSVLPLASVRGGLAYAGAGSVVVGLGADQQSLWEVPVGGAVADLARARRLTEGPFFDRQPVYSPDGKWLVFTSNRSGNLDLWRLELASGRLERLTDHPAEDWDPGLSADGRRLAFSSNRTGRFQIWLAEPDGGSPRPLTAVENAQNPSFSPDSAWIFFTLQDAGPERNGLWKIRTDGGEPTRIVAGSTFVPEVSADGRLVAFNRSLAGALVPIEGGTPLEIGPAVRFRWTNVGGALRLWLLDGGGRQTSIRRLALEPGRPPDPAEATTVLADPAGSLETFAVRPDGAALAVSRTSSENTLIVRIDGLAGLESPE